MSGWIKGFLDGSIESGEDSLVEKGFASWTRGRLEDISSVILSNDRTHVSLKVPHTEWYQFNRYNAFVSLGATKAFVTHRVIQAKMRVCHVGKKLRCSQVENRWSYSLEEDLSDSELVIASQHVGQWLTLILPEKDVPRFILSDKGKMYGS